jgi:Holliday junction resolvase RusA-like endonuclease
MPAIEIAVDDNRARRAEERWPQPFICEPGRVFRFEVIGAPRTKGNHPVAIRRNQRLIVLPSKAYRAWLKNALAQVPFIRQTSGLKGMIVVPVRVTAVFFRDRKSGDLDNYEKGFGDFLQRARLLSNDKLIASWDGSRLDVDRERPRVEVEIELLGHDA